jgi:hypothetical protein
MLENLSKYLFWDLNSEKLNEHSDIKLILERVFARGTEKDEIEVFRYYGKNMIKKSVVEIKYLDKKTLNYLSVILDIPKERFLCFSKSQLQDPYGIC